MLEARKRSISLFSDIAYRLETIDLINDAEWINDSKATDLDSSYYSLELMDKPVIWLVGSNDKEADYSIFDKLVKYKVKNVICFGEYETQIKYSLAGIVDGYAHKDTLESAVATAMEWAGADDVVLFSPGCASWPTWDDYRQRGDAFNTLVRNLV